MNQRLISTHFPYLQIRLQVGQQSADVETLLDTGFDGDVIMPSNFVTHGEPPDFYLLWRLADGSEVNAPAYVGEVQVGNTGPFGVVISAMGDEPLIGRGIIDRFTVTLERGQRVIVEL